MSIQKIRSFFDKYAFKFTHLYIFTNILPEPNNRAMIKYTHY